MQKVHKREGLRLKKGFNLIYAKRNGILCAIIKLGLECTNDRFQAYTQAHPVLSSTKICKAILTQLQYLHALLLQITQSMQGLHEAIT